MNIKITMYKLAQNIIIYLQNIGRLFQHSNVILKFETKNNIYLFIYLTSILAFYRKTNYRYHTWCRMYTTGDYNIPNIIQRRELRTFDRVSGRWKVPECLLTTAGWKRNITSFSKSPRSILFRNILHRKSDADW